MVSPDNSTAATARVANFVRAALGAVWDVLKQHGIALGAVLLVALFVQYIVLANAPLAVVSSDTPSYLWAAQKIALHWDFVDPIRTPLFPAVLLAVMTVFGEYNYTSVVIVQAILLTISALELYVLLFNITRLRALSAIIAILAGVNIYVWVFERIMLTEALACWSVITLLVVFERWLAAPNRWTTAGFIVFASLAWLARPSSVLFPVGLVALAALFALMKGAFRKQWLHYAIAFLAIYGLLGVYMIGNKTTNNYFGLSCISNVNILGKVIEYHMEDGYTNPDYATLAQQLKLYDKGQAVSPWGFLGKRPEYAKDYYATLGSYGNDIALHHLKEYVLKSFGDAGYQLSLKYQFYTPNHLTEGSFAQNGLAFATSWPNALAFMLNYIYWFLAVGVGLALWQRKRAQVAMLGIGWAFMANNLTSAFGSYADFLRLRIPLDWAAFSLEGLVIIFAVQALFERFLTPALAARGITTPAEFLAKVTKKPAASPAVPVEARVPFSGDRYQR